MPTHASEGAPNEALADDALDSTLLDGVLASLPPEQAQRVRALIDFGMQQAERVQSLQQIASALARTLDEDEIVQELVRGVQRLLSAAGVLVARVDLARGMVE